MVRYFCDYNPGTEIKGCMYKIAVVPPQNGYQLTMREAAINNKVHEKCFSDLASLANYILENMEEIEKGE